MSSNINYSNFNSGNPSISQTGSQTGSQMGSQMGSQSGQTSIAPASASKPSGGRDANFVKFDPTGFNKKFEDNEKTKKLLLVQQNLDDNDIEIVNLPHKQPIENIILDIRDLFFQILNIVEKQDNPIPYIFSSDKRQFSFALFLIIFGTLLLLLSSLMKSSYDIK